MEQGRLAYKVLAAHRGQEGARQTKHVVASHNRYSRIVVHSVLGGLACIFAGFCRIVDSQGLQKLRVLSQLLQYHTECSG